MILIVLGMDITFDSACAQALTFSFSRLSVLSAKMVPTSWGIGSCEMLWRQSWSARLSSSSSL